MKLIRFGPPGGEKPGVELDDGTRLDVSFHIDDYTPAFFAAHGTERLKAIVQARQNCPAVDKAARLGPPVASPRKLIAIGLNYRKHAEETGNPIPKEPEVFTKQVSCISGPNDPIIVPRKSTKLDYEVELAFVMADTVKYLENEADALKHVAGYLICNDVSERDFQIGRGSQWTKGKSHDGFGPLGPWLVTADEVGDPHKLDVKTTVNGEVRQHSNTEDFIFNCNHVIWYLSQFMTLQPGDVITTGTPHGVAAGLGDPSKFLTDGDTVELEITKLGKQVQKVKNP